VKQNRDFYDVIIVGGGVMGCAAAYYLKTGEAIVDIAVVEKDPTYSYASTTLSMANVRVQFSLEENVRVSMYAGEVLVRFEEEMAVEGEQPRIDFRKEGNLFLVTEENKESAERALTLQQKLGCSVEWWSVEEIKKHYPLYNPEDLAGGTFGPMDGHLDAYSLLMGYKAKARSLGTEFITDEVIRIDRDKKGVAGVTLASGKRLVSNVVINCAGAWAAQVAASAGVNLPVQPVKRQVFVVDTAIKPDGPLPLTNLPSGLYFRTDTGGQVLVGKSMPSDETGFDFNWDEKRFIEQLWPELAKFVPAFDRLKLLRGWAGLYAENTFDGNAILGQWPGCKGLYLANGFSGHGFQQAPAVGRYLSELILDKEPALDLSAFKPDRIPENKPLYEFGFV
jgi:glycine/D-amino acid oxidase-like deaminating enzyme